MGISRSMKYGVLAVAVVAMVLAVAVDAKAKKAGTADDTVTHKVYFDISIGGESAGEYVFESLRTTMRRSR